VQSNLLKRAILYISGLFSVTVGIAISVKSNLGVSPVSSVPYTMTCIWGIEMGNATILFHTFLVLLRLALLRKRFKPVNFLQIAAGVVFGYFTTFCNWAASFLPTPEGFVLRIGMSLISTVFIAFGIFLYMPANIMPLAAEGLAKTISEVTGMAFSKAKVGLDVSFVVISLICCLIFIRSIGSVGVGTILASFLVGTVVGYLTKWFGEKRDRWMNSNTKR